MDTKKATSIRLTPEAKCLLEMMANKLGVTQAAIIEIAIRRLADMEHATCTNREVGAK